MKTIFKLAPLALLVSVFACESSGTEVFLEHYSGTLAVDTRDSADVTLGVRPDKSVDVSMTLRGQGFGFVQADAPLTAKGKLEAFPEAGMDLYVAKWSLPKGAGGPCGQGPTSLALSLTRRGGNNRVGGSLTAYCGKDTYFGVPARVLRLSGDLPSG
jgi:hypothetical protein